MKPFIAVLTLAAMGCIALHAADGATSNPTGPLRIVTSEPGVLPAGASIVIRTDDSVNTGRAYRGTIYEARVAEEVVDQSGAVLIPKGSPAELTVRSFSYLGPGGVGMTGLTLAIESINVRGQRYPVATVGDTLIAGGIRANENAISTVGTDDQTVKTSGTRIRVPVATLLAFQLEDPIRLSGYRQ